MRRKNTMRNKKYFFLSIFFALAALVWSSFLDTKFTALQQNFDFNAELVSTDNFYDEASKKYSGEQKSIGRLAYESAGVKDGVLLVKNNFEIKNLSGEKIVSIERLYGVDPISREHVAGYGDKDRVGYLFAPRNLEKGENFIYWHINYDAPARMRFVGAESLLGLETYKYEANYELLDIDQTKNLGHLPGVPEVRGVKLEPKLTVWVEPKTGRLVNYEDEAVAYYYDIKSGERLEPWNKFSNHLDEASVAKKVSKASVEKHKYLIFETFVPGVILVVAFLFLLLYIFRKRSEEYDHDPHLRIARDRLNRVLIGLVIIASIFFLLRYFFLNTKFEYVEAQFEARVLEMNDAIFDRFHININVLRGAKGLIDASDKVEPKEWNSYLESLNLSNNFPGITRVGFSKYVLGDFKDEYTNIMRSEVWPEYKIWPEDQKDEYVVISYFWPMLSEADNALYGFDMLSELPRKIALEKARDSGEPTVSSQADSVLKIDTDKAVRFLVFVPVYKKDFSVGTVEERRLALDGYVYSPFRMENFINSIHGIRGGVVNVEIFDGPISESLTEENLIYSMDRENGFDTDYKPKFSKIIETEVGGHYWTIRYSSLPEFGLDFSRRFFPTIFVIAGIVLLLLIVVIIYELLVIKDRALAVAEEVRDEVDRLRGK